MFEGIIPVGRGVNPEVDGVVMTTPDFRLGWLCGGREILLYPNYIL